MSKQFTFYLLPSDTISLIQGLAGHLDLRVIRSHTPSISSSIVPAQTAYSIDIKDTPLLLREKIYLTHSNATNIQFKYIPNQNKWTVDIQSDVIEFSGCHHEADTLRPGRMYFQTDMLLGDDIWKKQPTFIAWADKVFRTAKKMLHHSKRINAYIGRDAEKWQREGGKFVTFFRADGTAVLDEPWK